MRLFVRTLFALCLATMLVVPALAADKADKKPQKKPVAKPANNLLFSFPKAIKLDAGQQEKLEALKKEYTPKLTELTAKQAKIMTPERIKARQEATAAAKKAGKKGKELAEAAQAALNLSKEEQKELAQTRGQFVKLVQEINKKKMALLTDEQKALLKPKKPTKKPVKKPTDK
jgi:hypothetical protein